VIPSRYTLSRFFILPPITVLAEDLKRRSSRHERDCRPKTISAEPPRRFCADIPPAELPDLRQRSLALETRPSRNRRRCRVVRRDGLDLPWPAHALARAKVSKFFKHSYEPLFFNVSLSFVEKIEKWRAQPTTSLQLVTNVLLLSLLAVGVMSMG
jgi:hypothetical protein